MAMRQLKISSSITNREARSLEKYLQEIGKEELITPDKEVQLAILIKQGNKTALNHLVKANLRFVVSVAKQYQNQGLSLADLINEGNIGLIKAAENFDYSRGFKFISYGVWWIRQSILQALAEHARIVRLPLNKVQQSNTIHKASALLEQQLERSPSTEEVAEETKMDIKEILSCMTSTVRHTSLDAPFSDDDEGCLADQIEDANCKQPDEKIKNTKSLQLELKRSLDSLNLRQQQTLCYYYGIGMDYPLSIEDIAEKLSLSTERIRQIKEAALTQLKSRKNAEMLREFL